MSFKTLLLLVLIGIFGTFIYLKVQILGDPNSNFNKTTRFSLGRYQLARTILGMHSYGDARSWYLKGNSAIVVEVVRAEGTGLDQQALNNFAEDIKTYTGRLAIVFDAVTIPAETLNDASLAEVASKYRRKNVSGEPDIFIVYSQDFARNGTEVGKTYQEYGIVLSDKRLKEVSGSNLGVMSQYVESTLLHELGHQLGLEHNEKLGCLMTEQAEKPSIVASDAGAYMPTKFCDFEIEQLNAIKNNLH